MKEEEDTLMDASMDHLIELLEKKEFRTKLLQRLNENIDLPFINESTELKILDALYSTILHTISNISD